MFILKKVSRRQRIKKNYPACRVKSTGKGLIKRYKTINSMQLSYSVNAIIWQTVYGNIGSTEIAVSDQVWQVNQETADISRTFGGNWSNQIWPNKFTCSFKYIWASTRENLSSMVCEQHRCRPACTSGQTDLHLYNSLTGKYHISTCFKRNSMF